MAVIDDLALFDLRNLPKVALLPIARVSVDDTTDFLQELSTIALDMTITNNDGANPLTVFLNGQRVGRVVPASFRAVYENVLIERVRITSNAAGAWQLEGFALSPRALTKFTSYKR